MAARLSAEKFTVKVDSKVSLQCFHYFLPQTTASTTTNNNNNNNFSSKCLVFVHPFGKMGGSAANMQGIAQKICLLQKDPRFNNNTNNENQNWSTIIFNHRGVGASTGSATLTGVDEIEDVVAVSHYLVKNQGVEKIFLVGSSAGACVAGSALDKNEKIVGGAFIGYVYGYIASILFSSHFKAFYESKKPKLLIGVSGDGFTSKDQFLDLFGKLKGDQNEKVLVDNDDVGHFEFEGSAYDEFNSEHVARFAVKFL